MVVRESLATFQDRLERHFEELRADRDIRRPGAPIFALEHGLTEGDLSVLTATVCEAVRLRLRPGRHWLPFVVHAAEVGYRYAGDEYWPTLEAQTPGWESHLGRPFVKQRFLAFARQFGGATPKGRWASQFTIICWPITHAILPTDLQRQLARILYDYRDAAAEQLRNPEALGQVLASHAHYYSKRFQQFSENTDLLGHVAAALLSEIHAVDTLLPSTLERILNDLSREREAWRWLKGARATADRVNKRGLSGPARTTSATTLREKRELSRTTSPVAFSAHLGSSGWQMRFRVPELAPLITRFPELREELALARCQVRGGSARPRSRGWLLYGGQQVTFEEWPGAAQPLFKLEQSTELAERIAEEVRTPRSQRWLFRLGSDGAGRLVRSGLTQSNARYVIIGEPVELPHVSWLAEAPADLRNAQAILVHTPDVFDEEATVAISALGFGVQTSVDVTPVGFVPASWDGSGYGEWLVGDSPMLMFSGSHDITTCFVTVNEGHPLLFDWEATNANPVVQLQELPIGLHRVRVSLAVAEGAHPVADGYMDVRIREAEIGRTSGTFREPLQIRTLPPGASIEEIWDGQASVEVDGPVGSRCRVTVTLSTADEVILGRNTFTVDMPLSSNKWASIRSQHLRGSNTLANVYDEAAQFDIEVADQDFGFASIRAEREIRPLRWGFRYSRKRTVLRLFQSGDTGAPTIVRRFTFEQPMSALIVKWDGSPIAAEEGGLFVATLGEVQTGAILPRMISTQQDLKTPRPVITIPQRNESEFLRTISLADEWAQARSPGDLLAEMSRASVLNAFGIAVASSIGGRKWQSLERGLAQGGRLTIDQFEGGVAKPGDWKSFRDELRKLASTDLHEPPVRAFSVLLGPGCNQRQSAHRLLDGSRVPQGIPRLPPGAHFEQGGEWLAEYLLRLASAPWTLASDIRHDRSALVKTIEHPLAFRAARLLYIQAMNQEHVWSWN